MLPDCDNALFSRQHVALDCDHLCIVAPLGLRAATQAEGHEDGAVALDVVVAKQAVVLKEFAAKVQIEVIA